MYTAAFNALPAHVAVVDAGGKILLVNEPWNRAVGASGLESSIGLDYLEVCKRTRGALPQWTEEAAQGIQRVLSGQSPSFSLDYPSRDGGERRWFRMIVAPLSVDGQSCAVVQHVDITGRALTALDAKTKEELNSRIIEAVPAAIIMISNEGAFLTANAEAQRILGLSFDKLSRKWVTDYAGLTIREDGSPCPVEEYPVSKCLKTREPQPAQTIGVIRPDGETVWAIFSALPLIDLESGQPSGALATFIDISERKRAEAALKESEERFRLLAERIREIFYTVLPDFSKVLYVSPAYEEIWGRTSQSLYDKPGTWLDGVHPDDRERASVVLGACSPGRGHTREYRVVRPDGSVRWVWDRSFEVRDEEGKPYRIVGIAEDVTERKRAEAEIADWQIRYETAIQASGQILYDWDPATNNVTYGGSHERILGYNSRDLAGGVAHWLNLLHPDDRPSFEAQLDRVSRTSEPFHLEYRVRRKDGSFVLVRDDGYFFTVRAGEQARMVGFIVDVTEQRKLEQQLRQSQKMEAVGRLAGGIAHDFNNLLTVILSCAEGLLEAVPSGEAAHRHALNIKMAGERGASMTRQLLALSRQQIFTPTVIDLKALLAELVDFLARLIGDETEIITKPEANLWSINADAGQITQVILNLAVNARDAMPGGGKLFISARNVSVGEEPSSSRTGVPHGDYVLLSVSDTGHGMDRETASRIFEPFFTTKAPGKGIGLGLSTVYGIVTQSKGHIFLQTEIGHGTTFEIYLPSVVTPLEPRGKGPSLQNESPGGEILLLVEDEETVRELLCEVLGRKGYTVLAARSGEEALKLSGSHAGPITLAVTDMVMPQMSGRELARRLDALRPGLKVLYMSGYTDDPSADEASREPGRAFIQKPFTPEELARKIRELLDA